MGGLILNIRVLCCLPPMVSCKGLVLFQVWKFPLNSCCWRRGVGQRVDLALTSRAPSWFLLKEASNPTKEQVIYFNYLSISFTIEKIIMYSELYWIKTCIIRSVWGKVKKKLLNYIKENLNIWEKPCSIMHWITQYHKDVSYLYIDL